MPAIPDFEEIRALAASLPCHDAPREKQVRTMINTAHGIRSEDETGLASWLARAQRREQPSTAHARVALFVAVHGIAADLDLASSRAVADEVALLANTPGDLHRLIEARDAELRLYELALHLPTQDSRLGPAMREDETARAMAYGMMAVEPGLDVVILASRGLGGDLAASAIQAALTHDARPRSSQYHDRIAAAARRHASVEDPLALLAALGGPDIAAMAGAILAARLAGAAIILDGEGARAAGAIVKRLRPDGLEHCLIAGGGDPPRAALQALDRLRAACAPIPAA